MRSSTSGADQAVLSIRDGFVSYGAVRVLHVEECVLPPGRIAVIRGGNGTGKTSLFRAICGLTASFTGTLELCGRSLHCVRSHQRALFGIRMVPQERHVFARLSPVQHLSLAQATLGCTQSESRSPLGSEVVGRRAYHWNVMSSSHLSGGQAKLLLLQAMVVGHLRLLILDEVYAGLDSASVDCVSSTIDDCLSRGVACLVADHTGVARSRFASVNCFDIEPREKTDAPYSLVERSQ